VQAWVEGALGAKISLGIEEPAQTVTVTEVAEVELPYGRDESGIQMHNGHVLLRVRDGEELLEIDETGSMIQRLANNDRRMGQEVIETTSPRLGYVLTVAREQGERVFRLYDRNWSLVSTTAGQDLWITAISEAGGYLLGWDRATYHLPACQGCMAAIYDPSLTVRATIPVGMMPIDADRENQFSPDEQTTYTHCDDKLQVYRTDGTFLWEAPWRQSRHLGNGGIAVQATADSLLLHDATGALVCRVVNPRPPEQSGEARARTTPGGECAIHSGDAVLVAKREGPQSCWLFDPGPEGYICWQSMSDDGRWIVAIDAGGKPREVSLVGAGGHVVWELDDQWFCGPLQRMLAPNGGYFYLFTRDSQSGPCKYCHVYRIDVE
ncbi:hypothetical protein JXA88_00005, partial [Candidatus Fermentibacteria bacterium]|nr:hypothetical protein [Candidatus Fermentibacteria bacterium]